MKNVLLDIFKFCINFIYKFFKLKKTNKKVVMISRQSNNPFIDFKLLENEFKKNNMEVVILCKKIEKGIINKFEYGWHIICSMYHLASAKYCVIDGYSVCVSMLNHKEDLKIMQIWHALGAIKKFGYQTLNKYEGRNKDFAIKAKMHKNYTYITCSSRITKKFYAEAFNIEEEKIKVLGMPRVDFLKNLNENYNKDIYKDYPKLKNKKNIVYLPTFRKKEKVEFEDLVNSIDKEKYNLIIRLHPLDKNIIFKEYEIDSKYITYDILAIADYIITDYSAVAIEAAVLHKPIFFYIYDYNSYINRRGLNIDLKKELPSFTCFTAKEIIDKIDKEDYDMDEIISFQEKYVETQNMDNTKNIVNFLINGEKELNSLENKEFKQEKLMN